MRTRLTTILALLVTGAMLVAAHQSKFESEQGRRVPLNSVYATFTQEPLMAVEDAVDQVVVTSVLFGDRDGEPKVALCLGADIASAVQSSANSFLLPENQVPVAMPDSKDALWVAAYLGTDGSLPAAYQIQSITIKDQTIRVTYRRDDSQGRSCDLRDYMIWAPLGRVEPGPYAMELFEATSERVTARRAWQIR